MSSHLGFRVKGRTPSKPFVMSSDDFDLRESAIECAQLLARAGWTEIEASVVVSDASGEHLTPIDWDRTKDAKKRLAQFTVTAANAEAVLSFLAQHGEPS